MIMRLPQPAAINNRGPAAGTAMGARMRISAINKTRTHPWLIKASAGTGHVRVPGGPSAPPPAPDMNKVPVAMSMDGVLYDYLLKHTREAELLAALRKETHDMHGRHMQITPEQGQLLALLVELMGAQKAIEVGVFTGYSALAVALALPEAGKLVALDRDARSMAVAKKYFKAAGVENKVVDIVGPAMDSLESLLEAEGPNTFDFAFLDADKRAYQQYFELLLQLIRPGGLIAVDNVLFYGKVADPTVEDKATAALRAFNDQVINDQRVSLSIIPVGDGMALCRKR
uniref:Caffeoyl-CoA O-methyltransferase n=2 Tax=Dunaliella tertiolecta TaxID=3047 RepID=A0A7S3QL53_DUNTE|mmetsp:Transcript_1407/g.3398  ORF Transcript_1407/g.3398 Transcript_1407/m.3398 type:complete len:286 (-) Transcript_1407:128-985(-)